jgi:hypothetical protein
MKMRGEFIKKTFLKIKEKRNNWGRLRSILLFPIIGFFSLLWVLFRVGSKPSRLRYPCMKIAVPMASGFLTYIIGIFTSLFTLQKAKEKFMKARYIPGIFFLIVSLGIGVFLVLRTNKYAYARSPAYEVKTREPNNPIGEAKGISPGRVVWVHDPTATNENCTPWDYGDGWFLNKNNNQEVIDSMLSKGIKELTGVDEDSLAWVEIFKYFNENHAKGSVSYVQGEKIFIKINATSAGWGNINEDLTIRNNEYYGIVETSPQLILSVLRHLINIVGVSQENISIGDPMRHIYEHCYDLWHSEFPNVLYLDNSHEDLGRTKLEPGQNDTVFYSDRGDLITEESDKLYTIQEAADYMINIPSLKGHIHAGMTLFAKNHFGSNTRSGASHLHPGLVRPFESISRPGYGRYRVQVDLMSHELIGGKELFFLADALWATSKELNTPNKWYMEPFNGDWCSSIFLSQDPVAIASVGYDFLTTEFQVYEAATDTSAERSTCVQMSGTDDYLRQAADSSNWTDSIPYYDPEGDGTPIPWSLGVHEHWNNAVDKQYSRNINPDDSVGIELVRIESNAGIQEDSKGQISTNVPTLYQNYPNPFKNSTTIKYKVPVNSTVELSVYNITGQEVAKLVNDMNKRTGTYTYIWDGAYNNGCMAPSGFYFCKLKTVVGEEVFEESNKILIVR